MTFEAKLDMDPDFGRGQDRDTVPFVVHELAAPPGNGSRRLDLLGLGGSTG